MILALKILASMWIFLTALAVVGQTCINAHDAQMFRGLWYLGSILIACAMGMVGLWGLL